MKKVKEKRAKRVQGSITEASFSELQRICDEEGISQSDAVNLAILAFIKGRKRKRKRSATPTTTGWIKNTDLGVHDPLPPLDQIQALLVENELNERVDPSEAQRVLDEMRKAGPLDDWKMDLILAFL